MVEQIEQAGPHKEPAAESAKAHAHPHPHPHEREDTHGHSHGEDHEHGHEHARPEGLLGLLGQLLPFGHGHSHGEASVDTALEGSERGIWALKVSLVGLGVTALLQLVVVLISGSVALLADTVHNASDALTAVPLWIAFVLSKRPSNRRYTYGYGRAEDVAGVIIVLMIALSAALAGYESVTRLFNPSAPGNLIWVAVASIVGFIGNELVAQLRIRVGNEIGSAALVADGQHARVDGLTSLGVLAGVGGVSLGFPQADPIVGLLITVAILFIVKDTALTMWQRLMDAVDPKLVERVERVASGVAGVLDVHEVRMRWLGHRLTTEFHIEVDEDLSTRESHRIVEEVRHTLFHEMPRLCVVCVHVDPCGHSGGDPHSLTDHHR
jgi:cation diffusion facilitator family transporter